MMNCEEFELRGLDLDRADADRQEAAAAAKHAEICGRCSAMLESWREVKCDLRLLRESTRLDSAPARVEMRLKQELRTRREARVPRGTVVVGKDGRVTFSQTVPILQPRTVEDVANAAAIEGALEERADEFGVSV